MHRLLFLFGKTHEFSPSHRVLNIVSLLMMGQCLMGFILNVAMGLAPALIILVAAAFPLYSLCYYLSRVKRQFKGPRLLFMGVSLPFMSAVWFLNGGSDSTVSIVYLGLSLGIAVLLESERQRYLQILLLLHLGLLMILERVFPHWVVPYPSADARFQDTFTILFLVMPMLLELIILNRRSYEEENQRAEAAMQMKSQFVATMSHELRTPMNAIIGFNHILLRSPQHKITDPKQRRYLERIDANAMHLLNLINEILDLSKIEAGEMEINWQHVCIGDLLLDIQAQMEVLASQKGLQIQLEVPEGKQLLETDAARLRQILINLIGNAIKFTSRGMVTIQVETDNQENPLVIHIKDTGPGIPPEDLERIFEAFTQLDADKNRQHGGTGLGLHITQHLCVLLGYRLVVQSVPDQGSCFSLWLNNGR